MFLALVLICGINNTSSCVVASPSEELFLTEKACFDYLTDLMISVGPQPGLTVKPGCTKLPGESA
jgi:hypothetical protein